MRRRLFTALAAIAACAITIVAQGSATARFQYERVAEVATPGPQRLDVDVALLSGSQPFHIERRGDRAIAVGGLNDLRLFAPGGNAEAGSPSEGEPSKASRDEER